MSQSDNNGHYHQWIPHSETTNMFETPQIIEYNPTQGNTGDSFSLYTTLNTLDTTLIRITFGSCIVPTQCFLNPTSEIISFHSLVPMHDLTSSKDPNKVPIYLVMIRENSKEIDVLDSWFAGYFSYRKRKQIQDNNLEKRARLSPETYSNYISTYALPNNIPNTNLQFTNFMIPIMPNQNGRPMMPSISSVPQPRPNITPIAPAAAPLTPASSFAQTEISADPFINIVRNPNLSLSKNLMTITQNWSKHEKKDGRRLAQFWRTQEGTHTIYTDFNPYRPKTPQDPPDFVISCIYWDHKDDYYLTSVDCVSLIEFLVGVLFTVEEKNRVRRQLEKFEPETIFKNTEFTSDYFKLIMSYTRPKPRKVEKDIKVYRWENLTKILDHVVQRFSPSFGSILSIIANNKIDDIVFCKIKRREDYELENKNDD